MTRQARVQSGRVSRWLRRAVSPSLRDRGDSVLTIALVFIPLLALAMGFAIDVNKSVSVGAGYQNAVQQATEAAVKTVSPTGKLNKESVKAFIAEYEQQVTLATGNQNDSTVFRSSNGVCDTAEVDGVEYKLPVVKVSLAKGRSVDTGVATKTTEYQSFDALKASLNTGDWDVYTAATVFEATVVEASPNFMLGMVGMPCQVHETSASAIVFGSNSSVSY